MSTEPNDIADRYTAVWNEHDAAARRGAIERLWVLAGLHFTPTRRFEGFDALEQRVQEAHAQFVRDKGFFFRVAGQPAGHHGVVKFYWEMVDPRTDAVEAVGFDVLHVDEGGRILSDHQFIEPTPRQAAS